MDQFESLMDRLDTVDLDVETITVYEHARSDNLFDLLRGLGIFDSFVPFVNPIFMLEYAVLKDMTEEFETLFDLYRARSPGQYGNGCKRELLIYYAALRNNQRVLRLVKQSGQPAASIVIQSHFGEPSINVMQIAIAHDDVGLFELIIENEVLDIKLLRKNLVLSIRYKRLNIFQLLVNTIEEPDQVFDFLFTVDLMCCVVDDFYWDRLLACGANFAQLYHCGNIVHYVVYGVNRYYGGLERVVKQYPWLLDQPDSQNRTPRQLMERLALLNPLYNIDRTRRLLNRLERIVRE